MTPSLCCSWLLRFMGSSPLGRSTSWHTVDVQEILQQVVKVPRPLTQKIGLAPAGPGRLISFFERQSRVGVFF